MTRVELPGHITEDGQLIIKLPAGLPAGDVTVTLELPDEDEWTDDEIRAFMNIQPAASGAEMAARLDAIDTSEWLDIDDPVAWVENVQRTMWGS